MAKNMSCQKQMSEKMQYVFNQRKHHTMIHDLNKKLQHNKSALVYNSREESKRKKTIKKVQNNLLIDDEKKHKTFCLKKSE